MVEISGFNSVIATLKELKRRAKGRVVVIVGYTAAYAVFVHENLDANHDVGQAKFLEEPARKLKSQLSQIVRVVYAQTGDLTKALLVAGLRLQRDSQLLVPIDTGNLKASAFTKEEKGIH